MLHPDTKLQYIDDAVGHGVVATRFIPKGTIVWVLDDLDRQFSAETVQKMDAIAQAVLEKYCYRDYQGDYILCWDLARFINHSFDSSMIGTAYNFELAARDIHPGEELTDDYGYFALDRPFSCKPESGSTRTTVLPDDIFNYYQEWDRKAASAFQWVTKVEQPLKPFFSPDQWQQVVAIATGEVEMDSILTIASPALRSGIGKQPNDFRI